MKRYLYFSVFDYICLLILSVLLTACIKDDCLLEQSLRIAGENRVELEKVLHHYMDDPEKLSASRFLIENMPEDHGVGSTDHLSRQMR